MGRGMTRFGLCKGPSGWRSEGANLGIGRAIRLYSCRVGIPFLCVSLRSTFLLRRRGESVVGVRSLAPRPTWWCSGAEDVAPCSLLVIISCFRWMHRSCGF